MSMFHEGNGGGEDGDVFQWLINESSTANFFEDQQYTDSGNGPLLPGHGFFGGSTEAETGSDFRWAEGLMTDSPIPEDSSYPNVTALSDDMGGAMDVVMGGPQTAGVPSAMHAFATEAATGQRRRPTQIYHNHMPYQEYRGGYHSYEVEMPSSSSSSSYTPQMYGALQGYPEPPMAQSSYYSSPVPPQPLAMFPSEDPPVPQSPVRINMEAISSQEESLSKRSTPTNKKKSADAAMSPRSLAQRERNREAVRNCRKRKREYAQKLKERETMLMEENARIRLQLKLGSEEMQNNIMAQCRQLAAQLKELVKGRGSSSSTNFQSLNESYLQTHADQGRNREEATKHIISRLIRQVEPTHVTKMYLWQTAQEDSYFKTTGGLWDELRTRLDLTKEQLKQLRERRSQVLDMCREIAAVLNKLDNLHALIMKRKRLSGESVLFRNIAKTLTEEQLAKFIVFVHEFPFANHEAEWIKYLSSFDQELEQEMLDKTGDWVVHNPGTSATLKGSDEATFNKQKMVFNEDAPHNDSDVDEDLMRNRHKSAIVLKELFERSEDELMGFAKAAFAPNIDLYDPNTVRVIHGIDKVLKYIRRIRMSFEGLTATEENFMTRKNVARGRWTLTGTYYGFGLKSGQKKEGLDDSLPKKPEGKKVSFKVVIAYRFIPGSAQIQQLLVSWAALDVMRQLSLLPESFKETLGERMQQENESTKKSTQGDKSRTSNGGMEHAMHSSQSANETKQKSYVSALSSSAVSSAQPLTKPLPKLDQKLKESKCIELTKIFQADTPEERLDIADELLDDNCIFQDANMGGAFRGPDACVDYVRRLRRPFSTMEMTRHNFVSVNKRKRGSKNKKSDPSSSKDPSPGLESRTQMGCLVRGLYSGALVEKPRPYEFNTTIFVTFNPDNHKIAEVEMCWNAAGLMKQLGVLQ